MKHKLVKHNEFYKVEGKGVKRLRKACTRCGDGTIVAEHKDRWYCGKCGMTVWKTKDDTKPAKSAPAKPEKKGEPKKEGPKQPEPPKGETKPA